MLGTLHELVGVIEHREFASSGDQFIELPEPGTAQLIQGESCRSSVETLDRDVCRAGTGNGTERQATSKRFEHFALMRISAGEAPT